MNHFLSARVLNLVQPPAQARTLMYAIDIDIVMFVSHY